MSTAGYQTFKADAAKHTRATTTANARTSIHKGVQASAMQFNLNHFALKLVNLWYPSAALPESVPHRYIQYFCPLIQTASATHCKLNIKVVPSCVTPNHFLVPYSSKPKIHFYIYFIKKTDYVL